jgi:TPR repeat protein
LRWRNAQPTTRAGAAPSIAPRSYQTAIYLLGVVTESGAGVPRDAKRAAQFFREAAVNAI